MVDIVIVLVIAVGAIVGWRKGVIMPLLTTTGALIGMATLYSGPFNGYLPSGAAGIATGLGTLFVVSAAFATIGAILMSMLHRFSIAQRADHVLGLPAGAAIAAGAVYVALVATITLDGWLGPLHGMVALNAKDVQTLQKIIAANPALSAFGDPASMQQLLTVAERSPVARRDLGQYQAVLGFYENSVRPSLLTSRLAPMVLSTGEGLPVVGRHVDFPDK